MKISQIKTKAPFNELFPITPTVLGAIKEHMQNHGYDESMPIVVWDEEKVVIDGHTRLEAARQVSIADIPVYYRTFDSEGEALKHAIHNQRDRRKLTDAEFSRCVEAVDKLREAGRPPKELASSEANLDKGKSAAKTAKAVGGSRAKVERTRAALSDPEVAKEVRAGKISINQGAKKVRAKKVKLPKATAPAPAPEKPQPKVAEQGKRHEVLLQAWTELRAWQQKYSEYHELAAIFEAIDKNYPSKMKPEHPLKET